MTQIRTVKKHSFEVSVISTVRYITVFRNVPCGPDNVIFKKTPGNEMIEVAGGLYEKIKSPFILAAGNNHNAPFICKGDYLIMDFKEKSKPVVGDFICVNFKYRNKLLNDCFGYFQPYSNDQFYYATISIPRRGTKTEKVLVTKSLVNYDDVYNIYIASEPAIKFLNKLKREAVSMLSAMNLPDHVKRNTYAGS